MRLSRIQGVSITVNFRVLLVGSAVLMAVPAGAQEPSAVSPATLSWFDSLAEASRSHPDLVSARETIRRAEAARTQAASLLFPQIDASASGSRSKTTLRADSYRYSIGGSLLLFDGFQAHFDSQAADRLVEAARQDYFAASADVRFRLRQAFVQLLQAQERLAITKRIAERRKQSYDVVRLRYDAGREHKGSLLTAEANLAEADFEVKQAGRTIAVAQRRLTKELGRTHLTPVAAAGELDASAAGETAAPDFEKLSEETPAVRALTAETAAARWDVRAAWAGFFPTVTADASAGRRGSDWPPHGEDWSAGVSVSLPIFEGGSLVANVASANASLAQAKADEKSGRDSTILDLESSWNDYEDAAGQVAVQAKFLEAARERNRIAESEYSTGLVTFNDWIIIEDNLVRTEKSYLDAKAQAMIARAAWEQARGVTLDED